MTALEIAMAGYLAFGQPTGDYYEAITKHSGLQVIHADGAVTLRLKEAEVRSEKSGVDGSKTVVVRLNDERYPFEVTRHVKSWDDCAVVETWAEIRHDETGPVRLVRADSLAAPVAVTSDVVRVLSLTGIAKNEANVSWSSVGNGQSVELVSSAGTRNAWEANAAMMVEFEDVVDEERGKVLGVALEWPGNSCRRVRRNWDGSRTEVFAGVDMTTGPYTLEPGETFTTPKAVLVWSENGRGEVSRQYHRWAHFHLMPHGYDLHPVLLNSWEGSYFSFTEKTLTDMMDGVKEMGGEMFVLDDGWFGRGKYARDEVNKATAGLGDWFVNAVRLHCCRSDFFPIAGSRETYSVVQDVVRNCGLDAQRYGITEVNGRHGWKESLRASSIQWMRRWLAGDETVPEINVEAMRKLDIGFDGAKVDCGLAGAACNVTSHGRVDRLPGFKSVFDCLKEDLAAVEKNRGERVTSRIKESAVRRAGISPCDFRSEEVAPQQVLSDGITILFEVYTLADGRKTPAVTFLPEGKPTGHVLVVDDRSNRSIHRMRVTQTLAEGKAITVADLWCLGETGAMYRKAWQGSDTADEVPSLMLYMLGKSMVGLRAEQIIVLAEAQRRRMGLLTEIVAHGNASIAAAHAYAARQELFSDIHCRHPPKSWADSVRKEEFIPFANVVNGALLDYDWTDLQKAR